MPRTITIAVMDPPYESETTTTVLRIIDAALRRGHKVNVFGYEGAVNLTMKEQMPHPNPVKGTNVEQQDHPTTARFIEGLFKLAGGRLEWVNCGLCVDERGSANWVQGPRRGGPADFYKMSQASDTTLVICTK